MATAGLLAVHWTPWIERCVGHMSPLLLNGPATSVFHVAGHSASSDSSDSDDDEPAPPFIDGGGGRGDSE